MAGTGKLKHASGWELEAEFEKPDPRAGIPGGGYVLRSIKHDGFHFAREVRVERIILRDGAAMLPKEVTFTLGSPDVKLVREPREEAVPATDPRGFYAPKWALRADYVVEDVFGIKGMSIRFWQRYFFTSYGATPSHEPSGNVPAARFYPILDFEVVFPDLIDEIYKVAEVRVDFRIESGLDSFTQNKPSGLAMAMAEGRFVTHKSTGTVGDNQAGLFRDSDSPGGLSVSGIFARAEKPLLWEVIAQGIRDGKPGDWDNIHQWPVFADGSLPPTPGMALGLHNHWRWFPQATTGKGAVGFLLRATGPQYGGTAGPGSVMIDPRLPNLDLRIAIAKRDLVPGVVAGYPNPIHAFDDLFVKHPSRPNGPEPIDKGTDLSTWFSFLVHRDRSAKPEWPAPPFGGALFVNGLFFAHELRDFISFKPIPPFGERHPQYIPSKPRKGWVRPP
ncbi:hypothetical protein [Microvirga splendida]|uniref:Uncharacterized protein n=1 Tax=Microvirga splendida TaxID=2795727 RepID=A0ABS0Y869_9HYPH|nr:hypothetical protein [Microvirga splendida]MBJ6128507.1 hypothetical protein [Microvirga splendida]